jgi:uncharacterized protein (DUF1499 family)
MDRAVVRSVKSSALVQSSRWASHVAQVHSSAERQAQQAADSASLAPAHYAVRKAAATPHVTRVLDSLRAPAQLSLF